MSDNEFITCVEKSESMREACDKLRMSFNTFKRKAIKLGVYKTNQGKKGTSKFREKVYKLEDILDGKHLKYNSGKIRIRLIEAGIFEDKCCKCGWNRKRKGGKYSTCELHHKDGNNKNHKLENLEILCPNCHSLTENFRNSKRK